MRKAKLAVVVCQVRTLYIEGMVVGLENSVGKQLVQVSGCSERKSSNIFLIRLGLEEADEVAGWWSDICSFL